MARQIERAVDIATMAGGLLGDEIIDAMEWVAGITRRIAATSDALDAGGAARAARRGVATVRGLVAHTVPRDERWEAFRLGTHLPRAAWVAALARAAMAVARDGPTESWDVAAAIIGLEADAGIPERLLSDRSIPCSVAYALAEAESAVLALDRAHAVGSAALPLAREAQSRLRGSAATVHDPAHAEAAIDRLLDGIGALVGAVERGGGEPGQAGVPPRHAISVA